MALKERSRRKLARRAQRLARKILPPILTNASDKGIAWFRRARVGKVSASVSRLHLGCGPHVIPGWANLDLDGGPGSIYCDLTQPLPVTSGSLRFIYSEHFIEHINRAQGEVFLRECRRVLAADGVLRISTPDLAAVVSEYLAGRVDAWRDVGWEPETPCQLVNEVVRHWGHKFVYDFDELSVALKSAGFGAVERAQWRESNHPELTGLESRSWHRDLIVEAAV